MNDILRKIVDATRADLAREQLDSSALQQEAYRAVATKRPHSFRTALVGGLPEDEQVLATPYREPDRPARIIAEIKCASPSAGVIVADPPVEAIAREYRDGGAATLSVVTEPHFFKGSREWMQRAAVAADLPVIMKDFIIDPAQIHRGVAAGADCVLLLASLLDAAQMRDFIAVLDDYQRDALVEVHDDRELDAAIEAGARLIGVNNRDLRDFSVSLETSERLVERIPPEALRVSESGIRNAADVRRLLLAGFDAFLVGESLLRQGDRSAAVRSLLQNASS